MRCVGALRIGNPVSRQLILFSPPLPYRRGHSRAGPSSRMRVASARCRGEIITRRRTADGPERVRLGHRRMFLLQPSELSALPC